MRYIKMLSLIIGLTIIGTPKVSAQSTNYKNYAICVYNFLKYASWPDDADRTTVEVVIYGTSKVTPELLELIKDKKPNGKTAVIKQTSQLSQIGHPQVIYVADNKNSDLKLILEATKDKSILILTEREEMVKKGACISFVVLENDALRFQINKAELEARKVKMSTSILTMAYAE
jgi:hypothetical protein